MKSVSILAVASIFGMVAATEQETEQRFRGGPWGRGYGIRGYRGYGRGFGRFGPRFGYGGWGYGGLGLPLGGLGLGLGGLIGDIVGGAALGFRDGRFRRHGGRWRRILESGLLSEEAYDALPGSELYGMAPDAEEADEEEAPEPAAAMGPMPPAAPAAPVAPTPA